MLAGGYRSPVRIILCNAQLVVFFVFGIADDQDLVVKMQLAAFDCFCFRDNPASACRALCIRRQQGDAQICLAAVDHDLIGTCLLTVQPDVASRIRIVNQHGIVRNLAVEVSVVQIFKLEICGKFKVLTDICLIDKRSCRQAGKLVILNAVDHLAEMIRFVFDLSVADLYPDRLFKASFFCLARHQDLRTVLCAVLFDGNGHGAVVLVRLKYFSLIVVYFDVIGGIGNKKNAGPFCAYLFAELCFKLCELIALYFGDAHAAALGKHSGHGHFRQIGVGKARLCQHSGFVSRAFLFHGDGRSNQSIARKYRNSQRKAARDGIPAPPSLFDISDYVP